MSKPDTSILRLLGPGILVAATGVGAGDLATGAFTGSKLGVTVLWAVVLGAGLKFVLNEGLARWQLATGETLLEGWSRHFGRPVQYLFLLYLLFWSLFVGSALMSACGVTAHAILPIWSPARDKLIYGVLHSLLAVGLVLRGGYRLFEKVMSVCIGVMFVTVLATAVAVQPDWSAVLRGLTIPSIPHADGEGLQWTVALMGGVGGTLTVLCYGYWIREEGREGAQFLRTCRIDLAVGYTATALFGIAMVILGSRVTTTGKGAGLVIDLARELEVSLGTAGPIAKWCFLIGAWGAVSSSLLGVWQSVPYLFADFWNMSRQSSANQETTKRIVVDTKGRPYRGYLFALAIVPIAGLTVSFQQIQKVYAIVGAAFMPMLALALLLMNSRTRWVGHELRNSILTTLMLIATLVFFAATGYSEAIKAIMAIMAIMG